MKLSIKNLELGYDDKIILRGMNFTFHSGLTILTGANGVGKTTLLRACSGVVIPRSGSLAYENDDGAQLQSKPRVSYVPHRPVYYSRLSGMQHLYYWALIYNMPWPSARQRAETLIKTLGMETFIEEKTDIYSRGQLQRLCILQCLFCNPNAVLLDEPVSGVYPETKEKIMMLLAEYASENGRLVVATSHEGDELNAQADYIVKMEKDGLFFQKTKGL